MAAASKVGASTSATSAGNGAPRTRWRASLLISAGTPPGNVATPRCCRGTTSTPGLTANGSGRIGRMQSIRLVLVRSRIAAGQLVTTAVYAQTWARRYRPAPLGSSCCPLRSLIGRASAPTPMQNGCRWANHRRARGGVSGDRGPGFPRDAPCPPGPAESERPTLREPPSGLRGVPGDRGPGFPREAPCPPEPVQLADLG